MRFTRPHPMVAALATIAILLGAGAELAAQGSGDAAADLTWSRRDLTSIERKIWSWLSQDVQEALSKQPLAKVKERLAKEQEDSPFKMPWERRDLSKEKDGSELLKIFDELQKDDRENRMKSWTLQDAIDSLRSASSEAAGAHAAADIRIELEEPKVRNPGTSNARIFVNGKTTGIKDGFGIRMRGELRYPDPDSLPSLGDASAKVKANRFQLEISLPRKKLLLGRYWVRVELDLSRVRKKKELMVGGELPMAFATRVAWVGVDEEYRNFPDAAPTVLIQDIEIKLDFQALIEEKPIPIGESGFPGDSEDVPHWERINKKLAQIWIAQAEQGVKPARSILARITSQAEAMGTFFDEPVWRNFLDDEIYPAIEAGSRYVTQARDSVLRERFPEVTHAFVGEGGIYTAMREYAALQSKVLYDAADLEPHERDLKHIRSRNRQLKDCFAVIAYSMKTLDNPRSGVGVPAVVALVRQVPSKSWR